MTTPITDEQRMHITAPPNLPDRPKGIVITLDEDNEWGIEKFFVEYEDVKMYQCNPDHKTLQIPIMLLEDILEVRA